MVSCEMENFEFGREIVWRPTPGLIAQSHLTRFMGRHGIGSLDELMRRSTADIAWFWDAVLHELDIRFYSPYSQVVDVSRGMPWPQWCVGGEMNIIHNCLDKYDGTTTDSQVAVRWVGEEGVGRKMTYAKLRREVNRAANALRSLGLGKGDAVGVFMPMTPEIVVAMLAIIKIGGIFLPLFSGFGAQAVASRLVDAAAKALFTADGLYRRGKAVPMKPVADEAAAAVPTLQHFIIIKRIGLSVSWNRRRDHWWHELIPCGSAHAPTEHTSAEDPLMIIYTSGTSGRPKGAVHTHCGFPVKAAQDILLGCDLHRDETLYWVADMGWMMGPWLVFGTLLLGATMVLYDGAPDYPGPDRLWALVERHQVTSLGLSRPLVRSLVKHGEEPVRRHNPVLWNFASTGEP